MSGFKLIAIRTLDKCEVDGKDLLKVLSPNTIYPFYSTFSFPNNDFETIIYNENYDIDLYSLEDLKINISAIVGSNGSGKSTLTELFLMANYNLGANFKLLTECTCDEEEIEKGDCDCSKKFNQKILSPKKEFALEIIFSTSENELILFVFKDGKIKKHRFSQSKNECLIKTSENISADDLQDFCYSIMVNYSHYALNVREIGDWINPLFHKNDGYQTPIVINPMRIEGNIDVNIENELLRDRLMSNILEPIGVHEKEINSLRNIASGKIAKKLIININIEKIANNFLKYDDDLTKEENLQEAIDHGLQKFTENLKLEDFINSFRTVFGIDLSTLDGNDPFIMWGVNYLFQKSFVIKADYNPKQYPSIFKNPDNWTEEYLRYLKADESHVAFKLKRVIYFLKYYEKLWKTILSENVPINIEDVSVIIQIIKELERNNNGEILKTIELILPSYLNLDIILSDSSLFIDLSSGEKHKIYSISSIVYHIVNINSVSSNKLKYKHVNIILDEIELYFHPDWQRKYIKELLDYINKIDSVYLKSIKGINIIFITHSPFIISDIPNQNVLKLQDGSPTPYNINEQTFGANIHDLLIDNFFMISTIGEYSKGKINEFLKKLNDAILNKKNNKPRLLKRSIKEIEDLGGRQFVELIADSLVRDKLLQLYFLATEQKDKDALSKYYKTKLEHLSN